MVRTLCNSSGMITIATIFVTWWPHEVPEVLDDRSRDIRIVVYSQRSEIRGKNTCTLKSTTVLPQQHF